MTPSMERDRAVSDATAAKSLFLQALEQPEEERSAFVARACAEDARLGARVEELLAAHHRAEVLFPSTRMVEGAAESSLVELDVAPGDTVGSYRLEQVLGEGGFGRVFLAEQLRPVHRRVALKVIKLGMDTRGVIARFEAERQALALMDHPHIARVFDAGATESGRPYFVMELVEGQPVTHYCSDQGLDVRSRLQLFRDVCLAIHHAHAKGVLHRDIKPSNVLVTAIDGTAQPRVIDFGVAKAMRDERLDGSVLTHEGHLVGTPEYMSPEQVSGHPDVDTRSDVYALGTLLFELLAGRPPFKLGEESTDTFVELRKRILEEDPRAPSTVASTESRRRGAVAFPPEADWITLRCLEKDRDRRYPTAYALALDVGRFLADEPIEAAPPSRTYRIGKLMRRHRAAALGILAVTAALLVGIVGTSVGLVRAARANEDLDAALMLATEESAEAHRLAEVARAEHANVLRLSAFQELEALRAEADHLWPAHPARLTAYAAWLERAERLVAGLPQHRATLASLRGRARAATAEERERDRAEHPARVDLAAARERARDLESRLDALIASNGALEEVERLEGELLAEIAEAEALEAASKLPWRWRFEREEDRWWHAQLVKLIAEIEEFADAGTGLIHGVSPARGWGIARREEWAEGIAERTVASDEAARLWSEAIASIADPEQCPAYAGLGIEPQLGLVPLGRDPASGLWEFGHPATGKVPRRSDDGRLVLTEDASLVFVLLPGGTFAMGAQAGDARGRNHDPHAAPSAGPVHEVTLSPFLIAKYEMTQAQWMRFGGANPSRDVPEEYDPSWNAARLAGSLLHPVEQVSWFACMELCERLGLALPTEAQWEYAARGGASGPWWTGDEPQALAGAANLADRYARANGASGWPIDDWLDDGNTIHARVGAYRANPFGLHDVHGNVWEWCRDGYAPYGRQPEPARDPVTAASPSSDRVIRGGSFTSTALDARVAYRHLTTPNIADSNLGLRPVREVQ